VLIHHSDTHTLTVNSQLNSFNSSADGRADKCDKQPRWLKVSPYMDTETSAENHVMATSLCRCVGPSPCQSQCLN